VLHFYSGQPLQNLSGVDTTLPHNVHLACVETLLPIRDFFRIGREAVKILANATIIRGAHKT
jgi:hypothetical protein